jgi:Tol biopolymer transport system component
VDAVIRTVPIRARGTRAPGALLSALVLAACGETSVRITDPEPNPGPAAQFDLLHLDRAAGATMAGQGLSRLAPRTGALPMRLDGLTGATDYTVSPDGRTFVFTRPTDEAHPSDLYVFDAVTRIGRRLVWEDGVRFETPRFSPDGRSIAFVSSRDDNLGDVWVMRVDGTERRNLTPPALPAVWRDAEPAWSPDGSRLAFVSWRSGRAELWAVRADGTGAQRLANAGLEFTWAGPAWAPDGQSLAVARVFDGQRADVVRFVLATGTSLVLTPVFERAVQPAWSPDGRFLAYVLETPGDPLNPSDLAIMTATGEPVARLPMGGRQTRPQWVRR